MDTQVHRWGRLNKISPTKGTASPKPGTRSTHETNICQVSHGLLTVGLKCMRKESAWRTKWCPVPEIEDVEETEMSGMKGKGRKDGGVFPGWCLFSPRSRRWGVGQRGENPSDSLPGLTLVTEMVFHRSPIQKTKSSIVNMQKNNSNLSNLHKELYYFWQVLKSWKINFK